MEIRKNTRLLDIINLATANPAILEMNIGGIAAIAEGNEQQRPDGLSPKMRLTEFYFGYYRLHISLAGEVKPDTLYNRELALRLWKEITGDPPLEAISVETVNGFVMELRRRRDRGERISNATIRKHCMALASVLNIAGPRCHTHTRAVGLIQTPPTFPPIHVYLNPTEKTPTLEEFEQLLAACVAARWPKVEGIAACRWWRAVYTLFFNTGLRRTELFSARWCDLRNMNGMMVLEILSENEKNHKNRRVPLNAWAMEAIRMMPKRGPEDTIIQIPGNNTTLQRWRGIIANEAGLPLAKCQFHAMRRMTATYVEDPAKVLGHTNAAVTRQHYQAVAATARYLNNLPQPVMPEE